MLSRRMIDEIERNADKLAIDLVETLRHDVRASAYAHLSDNQYRGVVRDLYANLGEWLESRTWNKLRCTYELKGRERFQGEMPLEQLVYSLTKTKQLLLDFIQKSLPGEESERGLELQLVVSVSDFFDRAIYHTICGYEDARRSRDRVRTEPVSGEKREAASVVAAGYAARQSAQPSDDELNVSRAGDIGEHGG